MKINETSVVRLHYSVATQDGDTIDSSFGGEPLVFLQGSGFLIKGLEDALVGKATGETFSLTVAPELAYGERQDGFVQAVDKSMFEGVDVEVGMQFRATTDEGEQSVIVIDIDEDSVTVDGNHPLAGITLEFEVEVIDVRDATSEEIESGQVAGPEGQPH